MTDQQNPSVPEITVPYDQFQISGLSFWIEANGYKPHLLVNTRHEGVRLPPQCMVKEQEVINIHSKATGKFQWMDDRIEFNARFGGKEFHLVIPYHAILAMNFAGTGQWIPMPWAVLADAKQTEVEITAVVEDRPGVLAVGEEATLSFDAGPAETTIKHAPRERSEAPSSDRVDGLQGSTVRAVDFRSRTKK